jgi:hypothetical protein
MAETLAELIVSMQKPLALNNSRAGVRGTDSPVLGSSE